VVWESNAIVRYLAARYGAGRLWPEDPAQRAEADRWMDWQLTTVQPAMGPVFMGLVRTPPERRDMASIREHALRLGEAMRVLDGHLAGRRFVAGDGLTMGDIPVGATCWRFHNLAIDRPELPSLARWYGELQAREPYRRHVMLPVT
jgi:glutathione S-transferase